MVADATPIFPVGDIRDDEEPDFVIDADSDVLGIEVTQIFHGRRPNQPPPKLEDAEREHITQLACSLAEAANIPPLMVSLHFGEYPLLRKSDRQKLAESVVGIVQGIVPAPGLPSYWRNDFEDLDAVPEKLDSISVFHIPNSQTHHWQCGRAGFIDTTFTKQLQTTIDGKGTLLDKYLKKCDRCWLVVAADWGQPSSFFEFTGQMASHDFTTAFERVFFVEGFGGHVNELQTNNPTEPA